MEGWVARPVSTPVASVYLKAKNLVGTLGTERILTRIERLAYLDPVQISLNPGHIDADGPRLLLRPEENLAVIAFHIQLV